MPKSNPYDSLETADQVDAAHLAFRSSMRRAVRCGVLGGIALALAVGGVTAYGDHVNGTAGNRVGATCK